MGKTKASSDPLFALKIQNLQHEIAKNTKFIIDEINAWWGFLNWASKANKPLGVGINGADIILNDDQSAEFAFALYQSEKEDIFLLYAQESNFKWLSGLNIKALILNQNGIMVVVDALNNYNVYISGINFIITVSSSNKARLNRIVETCKIGVLGCIKSNYDTRLKTYNWSVKSVSNKPIPVFGSYSEFKRETLS